MGSAGIGSVTHICGELFKMLSGVNLVHVPYRGGGPALVDLLGGQVQVMFVGVTELIEHIKAGRLRALAVTTATRSPALPDIPTVGEFVAGYEAFTFHGIGAPKGTPPTSSISSTRRPTRALPIPSSRRGLPTWAARRLRARPPTSADSSPTKPRSGPR